MRAYGYSRVSGKSQVEGDGPERQLDAIKTFCSTHELVLQASFFEKAVSGTVDAMDRPAFAELIERIGPDGAQSCIVVERMDRLARDLMIQEVLFKECRDRGIQVFASDRGDMVDIASDGGDPTRKLIRHVMGALAEWEKATIVLKLQKARARKRFLLGRCEGPKPYGYFPAEQDILGKIRRARADNKSLAQIAYELNEAGIRTRYKKPWNRISVFKALKKSYL